MAGSPVQFVPSVAGISIVHESTAEIRFDTDSGTSCASVPEGAVRISHTVGRVDTSRMELLFTVVPGLAYYRGADGYVAMCSDGDAGHGLRSVLTTVRPGFDYRVDYERIPDRPVSPRAAEIVAYSLALASRRGGVMAHGCGLILPNGAGALCLGVSGAGKSTLARMMLTVEGVQVLNDDRNVLTAGDRDVTMWSTPWPGNAGIATSGSARLAVIALIAQSEVPFVRPLEAREAIPLLLKTLLLPLWTNGDVASELNLLDRVCLTMPVVELGYPLKSTTPRWIVQRLVELAERWTQ
jgi:hypothetical protein